MKNKAAFIKTDLSIVAKCKCGEILACSIIYGGLEIGADLTRSMAEIYQRGGSIEIVNTSKENVTIGSCTCKNNDKS